jgi:hypothetical protein
MYCVRVLLFSLGIHEHPFRGFHRIQRFHSGPSGPFRSHSGLLEDIRLLDLSRTRRHLLAARSDSGERDLTCQVGKYKVKATHNAKPAIRKYHPRIISLGYSEEPPLEPTVGMDLN